MKLAEAFQAANERASTNQQGRPAPSSPAPNMKESTQHGTPIHWTDIEWLTVARELMRLHPELGLPNPDAVGSVRLRHMHAAMQALPVERRRHLVALTLVRPRLIQCFKQIINGTDAITQRGRTVIGPLPPSVIYRQPDGAQNGAPPSGTRIYWREPEWYAVAVELAYMDPSFLDTLNHLLPSDVYKAQRVLPTNRRRPQTSFNHAKIRAELAPAFRRVRAAIDAKRSEEAQQQAAAQAEEAQRAEQARQAAEMAAQAALREEMAQSPEFIAKALSAAAFGPLLEALIMRGAASLQGILENALVNAFSSDAVKRAMVVNVYMDKAEASAQSSATNAPTVSGNVAANAVYKPKIGILGALAQQGEALATSFPQLRIKVIDKNLTGPTLRDAIAHCDRVISMCNFISHSMDSTAAKTMGDRYTRVDGGVSAVRRQIDIWLSSGALRSVVVPANEQPNESKGA